MTKVAGTTKGKRIRGTSSDITLSYATTLDPSLEQWRILAAEWLGTLREGKSSAMDSLKVFLVDYVHGKRLETDPAKFLRAEYLAPCLYASCLSHLKTKGQVMKQFANVSRFLGYVLTHYYSVEDDNGIRIVPSEFRNPIPGPPEEVDGHAAENQESDKNVLPYHFIGQLRSLLCPTEAKSFADWQWAQAADVNTGGSWFVVPFDLIDIADPDCVWRLRETSAYEQKKFSYGDTVHELWSPAVAVALYVKLQLPLRTYQVRMLDSGEADTYHYVRGTWVKNTGPLAKGTKKNSLHRGVFHQMTDDIRHVSMTGLYINTNKTADRGKEEWNRGYTIPWEHPEVLLWLEKLRDWQTKYNPIVAPLPWTELELKHTGGPKAESSLKAMGSTCFLFRDAAGQGDERFKPISGNGGNLASVWYKLLEQLEIQCAVKKVLNLAGSPLVFVAPKLSHKTSTTTTYYPLHSLRVSLITAYALEGGVPMAILSKCIAGHARLIMTLYYTKAGITYCTETMDAATKRLMVDEQENYGRWLKDKSYEQLEASAAFSDPAAIRAVMAVMQSGASLVKDDKGFCPKGGWGCDSGGVYVNDDTGRVTFGEVPGYPQKNCPRCRWFLTGPAFIDGLNNHWNHIQLQMGDIGERVAKLEGQIITLEDRQFECQENDQPFMEQDQLNSVRKIYQAEVEKNNKLAEDSSATYRLIARCAILAKESQESDGVQLVAVGALQDVHIAIDECSKLQQVMNAVAGSTVYPEHDVSKAVLQAGNAYDMMLENSGKKPIFFRLSDEDKLTVAAHMTRLLATEAGSIKDALPFVEGARRLAELGLNLDMEALAREMAASEVVQLGLAPRQVKPVRGQRRLSTSGKVTISEVSHVAE